MNAGRDYYLIMYDITHDRTLQKVAKMLEQAGYERINYSVWLGWQEFVNSADIRTKLKKLLTKPEAKGSKMFYLRLKRKEFVKMRKYNGRKIEEMEYWLGERANEFY